MGLFRKLFGKKEKPPIVRLTGNGDYELDAVGESNYQKALLKIIGGKTEEGHHMEVEAILIQDDCNPYDNKAIAVSIEGEIVGYLSREHARQFRKLMAEAGGARSPAVCDALIVGGWNRGGGDEGHFGVRLDLPME